MNILMLSDVYFPRVNGVSTSIATTRRTLHELGHATTLVAPVYPGDARDEHAEGNALLRVAARRVPFDPEDRLMRRGCLRRVAARLDPRDFDVIHIHTPFIAHRLGVRLGREWGIPVVETYHTFFEEYLHHYLPILPARLARAAARRISRGLQAGVQGFVVPSTAILAALRNYGMDIPMRVVPTGLDLEEFTPGDRAAFCRLHDIDPERRVLVYVGRVAFEKNIDLLLEVLAQVRKRIPDVLLIIAGDGPAKAPLERRARHMGLQGNVLFIGYLERGQALWDCFAAGDAFVFASRTETQGLVLLEALALGVPVVAYAELGARDVLVPDCGAVIVEGDAGEFTQQVIRLLCDDARRELLGRQGIEYARGWSTRQTTLRLVDFYQEVIAGRQRQEVGIVAGVQPP
jgi:glycosyltransferase involved in cell wall biosynthesis